MTFMMRFHQMPVDMKAGVMNEFSELLKAASGGDREASQKLLPLVYEELRILASSKLRQERIDHTLNATALVHEAYMRLIGEDQDAALWDGEGHFFGAASEAMRRILVDHARHRARQKRGGGWKKASLEEVMELPEEWPDPEEIILLDAALTKLAKIDPTAAELVNLRFFGRLPAKQAAVALGISLRTSHRIWAYARAWLYDEICSQQN